MSNQLLCKLISAYTNEAGQVTVDADIIKAVQEADRIYILAAELPITQDLAQKTSWKIDGYTSRAGNFTEWGYNMPLWSKKSRFCHD